jgi:argonaute-like protein implicated in RNA metabolism and viral defense
VLRKTIGKNYAIPNIVLGILGKTGNIPFVLANPLPFTDMVVGIDVAREKKQKLAGSVNVAAIARIYFSDGQFIKYVIHDEPIEGETIPVGVLQSMFPASEFNGKRIVVHRDGYFRGNEANDLMKWGKDIGATIFPVEVIKSGTPRLYGADSIKPSPRGVGRPMMGTALLVNSREAVLASTPPIGKDSTPQPLRIRTGDNLSIKDAIQSVLSLTLLHYGSTSPPKLPVTIHYSDKIAGLALKGVKPKSLEGDRPYWL